MITVTIELDGVKGVSQDIRGVDIGDLLRCVKQAALALGFHPDNVNEYFPEEE